MVVHSQYILNVIFDFFTHGRAQLNLRTLNRVPLIQKTYFEIQFYVQQTVNLYPWGISSIGRVRALQA